MAGNITQAGKGHGGEPATLQALQCRCVQGPGRRDATRTLFQQQDPISLAGEGMSVFPCPGTAAMDSSHIPVGTGPQRLHPSGRRALSRMQPGSQLGQAWADGQQGHRRASSKCRHPPPWRRVRKPRSRFRKSLSQKHLCDHGRCPWSSPPLTPDSSAARPATHPPDRDLARERCRKNHTHSKGERRPATSRHQGAQGAQDT